MIEAMIAVRRLHPALIAALVTALPCFADGEWPQFRGPAASGVAPGKAPPSEWNVESGDNIRWKTQIPGLGYSCPIIWGDRIFLTAAVDSRDADPAVRVGLYGDIQPVNEDWPHRFVVLCLKRSDGSILWQKTAHEGVPKIKRHPKASHANSTPATDGRHVVAFFGSEGLYCYDFDGELKWKKDFGVLDAGFYMVPDAQWGFGSSPIIHKGRVIVQCDVQKNSFLAAFDVQDGREIWRVDRNDVPTWSTPNICEVGGRTVVLVNGYREIGGYEFETGKEVWTMQSIGDIPVPTPVVADKLAIFTSAHGGGAPLTAVKLSAKDDITLTGDQRSNDSIAWFHARRGNYMQTPLAIENLLYTCMDNGVVNCFDIETGQDHFRRRIGGGQMGFTASPVAAGGKLFFTSENGEIHVSKIGTDYEPLAINEMNEVTMATPAIADGVLYVRTQRHLVAIGE